MVDFEDDWQLVGNLDHDNPGFDMHIDRMLFIGQLGFLIGKEFEWTEVVVTMRFEEILA